MKKKEVLVAQPSVFFGSFLLGNAKEINKQHPQNYFVRKSNYSRLNL